jgi:hypothetical protein
MGTDTPRRVLLKGLRETFGLRDDRLILIQIGANLERFTPGDREDDRWELDGAARQF